MQYYKHALLRNKYKNSFKAEAFSTKQDMCLTNSKVEFKLENALVILKNEHNLNSVDCLACDS